MNITEADREAARLERERSKSKMSEAAKNRLREVSEHDRKNTEASERITKEFNSRPWTVEQLTDFFQKHLGGIDSRRRAIKSAYRLIQGGSVHTIHDLVLFGELSRDEGEMSMYSFLKRYPLPESEVITVNVAEETHRAAKEQRCMLGARCVFAFRGKGAPVKGRSLYCSKACRGRAKVVAVSQKPTGKQILTRINTGENRPNLTAQTSSLKTQTLTAIKSTESSSLAPRYQPETFIAHSKTFALPLSVSSKAVRDEIRSYRKRSNRTLPQDARIGLAFHLHCG